MNFKKKISSCIIASSFCLYAVADYLIIVDKFHNNYEITETPIWSSTDSTLSSWSDTGTIINCTDWSPTITNQKSNFNQTETCDFEQERTENIREISSVDGEVRIVEQNIETQFVSRSENRNIVVTSDSPIVEQNNYNCGVWTPAVSTVYTGTNFEQERYCDIDMLQNWVYSLDGSEINNWEERYTLSSSEYETQIAGGTKTWESETSLYSEWSDTGTINNCNTWLPEFPNQKSDFIQSATCDFEQTRTRTERETNPETGVINVTGTFTETQVFAKTHTRDITVTSIPYIVEETSCGSWSPLESEIYAETEFTQTRSCNVDKMVEWTYSRENASDSYWEERYTDVEPENQQSSGVVVLENCKNILDAGHSRGDDYYNISFNGGMNVKCDMTRNGGGWTQITNYNFDEDPDNVPAGLNKTVDRTIISYTGSSYTFQNSWLIDDNNTSGVEVSAETNGMSWTQTMVDLYSVMEISLDSFNVATATVNGQYVDGVSLTYGESGSRTHLFTTVRSTSKISNQPWINPSEVGTEPNMTGANAFLSNVKPSGTEKISIRMMANQAIPDESVGMKQFTVWIKE